MVKNKSLRYWLSIYFGISKPSPTTRLGHWRSLIKLETFLFELLEPWHPMYTRLVLKLPLQPDPRFPVPDRRFTAINCKLKDIHRGQSSKPEASNLSVERVFKVWCTNVTRTNVMSPREFSSSAHVFAAWNKGRLNDLHTQSEMNKLFDLPLRTA